MVCGTATIGGYIPYNGLSSNSRHASHNKCKHTNMGYCAQCEVPYCKDCNKEWSKQSYWNPYASWTTTNTEGLPPMTVAATDSSHIRC